MDGELYMYRISADTVGITAKSSSPPKAFNVGHYVAAMYDKDWYVAIIQEICTATNDAYLKFMNPRNPTRSLLVQAC